MASSKDSAPSARISALGSAESPALAFLELSSIARGLFVTDVAVKKAPVRVLCSQPISSGKHVLLFMGDVASVEEAHAAASMEAGASLLKQVLIPNVHAALVPWLGSDAFAQGWGSSSLVGTPETSDWARAGDSLAVCESSSVAGAILAADRALKAADVGISRLRLGQGIGGKAYFVLHGELEDIQAASDSAQACLTELECLARIDVIARPEPEAAAFF